MIRNSFVFLPKVTLNKEKKIWESGIHDWDNFLKNECIKGISNNIKSDYDSIILDAKKNLYAENSSFFTKRLPTGEHWRLYNFFKDNACYLDIETTGYHGDITVLGIYDGINSKTFVKGETLYKNKIEEELSKYKMFVTFNGASFDIPVIKKEFNTEFIVPHMDLRFVLKKIGYSGGLKNIESELGIKRAEEVVGVTGEDAVYLWNKYKRTGDRSHLDLLVKYNEEDIVNLKQLAEFSVPRLWKITKNIT